MFNFGFFPTMSKVYLKPRILPVAIFMMTSIFLLVCSEDVAKPEKIFRHDRMEPEKLARIDMDNEELRRTLEDLRQRIPEYTGYLFLDVIVEVFKMFFISLMRLLGQQRRVAISTE